MDHLVLRNIVHLEGRDPYGRRSTLTLSPNLARTGWLWEIPGHGFVPVGPDIMQARRRRVALVWGEYSFENFENVGILRAAGLHHVCLHLSGRGSWPPYDGRSLALWQAVMHGANIQKEGTLVPYSANEDITMVLAEDSSRVTTYRADKKELRLTGNCDFKDLGKHRFGHIYPHWDILRLVRARTLGWPAWIYDPLWFASRFGWPHLENIVWPGSASPKEVLEEAGLHRLLDCLAILNFAAPNGHYLTGLVHSRKGNHVTEVSLLKALTKKHGNVVPLRRIAAA